MSLNKKCLYCNEIFEGHMRKIFCCKEHKDKHWYVNNSEYAKKQHLNHYHLNKDYYREYQKEYVKKNKDKIKKYNKVYYSNRKKTDIEYKLKVNLRKRLNSALRNNQKTGSAIKDLGCTILELKKYLEVQFQPGMAWDNWSRTGWHIDHIEPLDSFNLSDIIELRKACHYSNLQPLWAKDNLSKGSKSL